MNINQIVFYLHHWSSVVFSVVTSAAIESPTFSATTVALFSKISLRFAYNPI